MNSGTQTASTKLTGKSVSTTTMGSSNSTSGGTSNVNSSASTNGKTGSSATGSQAQSTSTNPTQGADWFTNYQTQIEQNIAKKEGSAEQVIGNSNSSTQQINQAQQELRQYMNLDGALMQARQAILGEGYQNCVIVPNTSGNTQVYVQAKQLTAADAVKVMNIVSQQMNIPINSVVVHKHA